MNIEFQHEKLGTVKITDATEEQINKLLFPKVELEETKVKKWNKIDYGLLAQDWYSNHYNNSSKEELTLAQQKTRIRHFIKPYIGYIPNDKIIKKFKDAFDAYVSRHNNIIDDRQLQREITK